MDINEYQKAIEVIKKALNIRPDFAEGYNTLGLALYKVEILRDLSLISKKQLI